jgi:hypothetical protein
MTRCGNRPVATANACDTARPSSIVLRSVVDVPTVRSGIEAGAVAPPCGTLTTIGSSPN